MTKNEIIDRLRSAAPHRLDQVAQRSAAVAAVPEHASALNAALGSCSLYNHFEREFPSSLNAATRHAVTSAAVAFTQRSKLSPDEFAILTYAVEPIL